MTFPEWVQAVLSIARDRGIVVTIDYPQANWVTFNWHCKNYTQYGSAGAGAEFIHLTSPEAYTWLWRCGPSAPPTEPEAIGEPWDRHGRYVPRVPAMAVSDALRALFAIALNEGMPGTSGIGVYTQPANASEPADLAAETLADLAAESAGKEKSSGKDKNKDKGGPS